MKEQFNYWYKIEGQKGEKKEEKVERDTLGQQHGDIKSKRQSK